MSEYPTHEKSSPKKDFDFLLTRLELIEDRLTHIEKIIGEQLKLKKKNLTKVR
jgi:hypothetical protein